MALLNLIKGTHSWTELEVRIAGLPSEKERGDAFEEFCQAFFAIHPLFQFDRVYKQKEIPQSVFKRLGYPVVQDIGIDGVALTPDDKIFAYQAKFRTDRNHTPSLRELGTFFTMSDKADWRIVITNANSLPAAINDRVNHNKVLSDSLDQLEPDFFRRLRVYLEDNRIEPPEAKKPHITQQESIEGAVSYFRANNRGQLILPCGTGKTLTALWIAEQLSATRILVLVPSLYLLRQTLREWAENSTIRPFNYLCLCSDTTVDLGNDSPVESIHDLEVPVTTDADTVSDFLMKHNGKGFILFSTYQSSKALSEATLKAGIRYDFAVFDEAHRTASVKAGVWNLALDDVSVPIGKRLFMTATPRIYQPHIIKKAEDEDVLICSMDDHKVYGEPFYQMRFGQAIDRGHITDYKVVVIFITDAEVREIIQRGGRVITDEHE